MDREHKDIDGSSCVADKEIEISVMWRWEYVEARQAREMAGPALAWAKDRRMSYVVS